MLTEVPDGVDEVTTAKKRTWPQTVSHLVSGVAVLLTGAYLLVHGQTAVGAGLCTAGAGFLIGSIPAGTTVTIP